MSEWKMIPHIDDNRSLELYSTSASTLGLDILDLTTVLEFLDKSRNKK